MWAVRSIDGMKLGFAISLLMFSVSLLAHPYDGQMSMFENGKEVTKTYHQILRETPAEGLSPSSRVIHERALDLFNNPELNRLKEQYLASFPRSFVLFLEIFMPKKFDQLYDGYIHIHLVNALAAESPDVVGDIYLKLASEACLTADAPNYLRHKLVAFEKQYPDSYKKHYDSLTDIQRGNVDMFKSASLHSGGSGVCDF